MMADPAIAAPAAPAAPPAAPAALAAPQSSPQPASRPGSISAADYHRLDPAQQSRYANLPDGVWIERAKLEASADATKPGDPAAAKPGDTSATAPALIPDQVYQFGDLELKGQEILDLLKFKGETDLKATRVPDDASKYEPRLPEGMQLPDGMDFKPDPSDPSFKDFQALSKKLGLTQNDFEQLYGIWVNKTVQSEAAFRNSMKAQLDALGVNATMRVTALETWLRGTVGEDLAKHMRAGMFSAKIVQGLELIATKMTSQGAAQFSQAHREPAGPQGRVSEEEWAGMSSAEKWSYARGHDQAQFKTANRGG
jgi:hypothetical protein